MDVSILTGIERLQKFRNNKGNERSLAESEKTFKFCGNLYVDVEGIR